MIVPFIQEKKGPKESASKNSDISGVDYSTVKVAAASSLFVFLLIHSNYKPIRPHLYNEKLHLS